MDATSKTGPPHVQAQIKAALAEDNAADQGTDHKQRAKDEQVRAQGVAPLLPRVDIEYTSIRRREVDADASFTKWFTDGLVKAGVLRDDRSKFVKKVSCEEESGEEDWLVIELWEVP